MILRFNVGFTNRFSRFLFFPLKKFSNVANNKGKNSNFFGFEPVSDAEKFDKVHQVFTKVAEKYDLMNDAMSLGIHRCWKKRFIELLNPYRGTHLLDVAGGTGDIAFQFLRFTEQKGDIESSVTICDINQNMLDVGKKRSIWSSNDKNRCKWVLGDAMNLPFESHSFDAYTIAFGIRNVVNIDKAVEEAFRVLKPGGIFMCLEFSKVDIPLWKNIYDWYSFQIIPILGEVISNDRKSYQYLIESVRKFPDQETLRDIIKNKKFTLVNYENFLGGIASIHYGYKSL